MHQGDEPDDGSDHPDARYPPGIDGSESKHQRDGTPGNDQGGRERIEQVLDCECRQRPFDWFAVGDVQRLGWLADEDAQEGQIAEGVSRPHRLKRRSQIQLVGALEAAAPSHPTNHEPETAEGKDSEKHPTESAD